MTPLLVFDLDGTLIDGYAGIAAALASAMERLGLPPLPAVTVRGMVGHGIERLLEKAVGKERALEGARLFREAYPRVALEKTTLMPDVVEVLTELGRRGYKMAVASNKLATFSRQILESLGVGGFFFAVAGPDSETPVKPDPTMLRRLMSETGVEPGETVVVGDMEVDAELARAAGCRVVLVPGGSRTREELAQVDADALLDRLADLPAWLMQAGVRGESAPSPAGRGSG
jgi:phosphoglycolate phosphatase